MTAPLNGHATPAEPLDPRGDVARGLYESQADEGDTLWAALPQAERDELTEYVGIALTLYVGWMTEHGFKIVPPGATPIPTSEPEAMAMVQAAKQFMDGRKRKGALLGGAVGRKLILPKGTLQ